VAVDPLGLIIVDEEHEQVILAMGDGKTAAQAINTYLSKPKAA
jgi:thioredoxin reductase